jgi:hypothetical protein
MGAGAAWRLDGGRTSRFPPPPCEAHRGDVGGEHKQASSTQGCGIALVPLSTFVSLDHGTLGTKVQLTGSQEAKD